jgi:mRNA degradation ribonuclease J1/J2
MLPADGISNLNAVILSHAHGDHTGAIAARGADPKPKNKRAWVAVLFWMPHDMIAIAGRTLTSEGLSCKSER